MLLRVIELVIMKKFSGCPILWKRAKIFLIVGALSANKKNSSAHLRQFQMFGSWLNNVFTYRNENK